MSDDDWLSRKFWEKVIGITYILMMIVSGLILYLVTIVSVAILPSLGELPWWIAFVLLIGMWYKTHKSIYAELDRRFPPFNKSGDSIQRMQNEIDYNYKNKHS